MDMDVCVCVRMDIFFMDLGHICLDLSLSLSVETYSSHFLMNV